MPRGPPVFPSHAQFTRRKNRHHPANAANQPEMLHGRTDDAFRRNLTRPIVDTIDDENEPSGRKCKNGCQKAFMCLMIAILLCTSVTFAALWRLEVGKEAQTLDNRDEIPDVRRALIDLFFSTNSNRTWSSCDAAACEEARCQGKVRWVSQEHYCSWKCVSCDAHLIVTGLFLAHNRMSGTLPASLTWISSLQTLDVSQNPHLAGTLPASLGGSAALRALALNSTQISGTLPVALSRADQRATPSNHPRPCALRPLVLAWGLGFRPPLRCSVSLALASPLADWSLCTFASHPTLRLAQSCTPHLTGWPLGWCAACAAWPRWVRGSRGQSQRWPRCAHSCCRPRTGPGSRAPCRQSGDPSTPSTSA